MTTLQKAGLLALLPKMSKIDAMECAIEFQREYGERIDWHEFAYYLGALATKKVLTITQPGGMVQYKFNS